MRRALLAVVVGLAAGAILAVAVGSVVYIWALLTFVVTLLDIMARAI